MDLNDTLENIISKYQLDHYYPHYKNMCMAENVLRDLIGEIIQCNKQAVFVGDDRTGLAFVRNISKDYGGIRFFFYDKNDLELSRLEENDFRKDEEIYLISYYGAEYVEKWFRMHHLSYEWIYDIFERRGVSLQREFFVFGKENLLKCVDTAEWTFAGRDYVEPLQCELYCQQCKYKNADHPQTKRIALEKCLFIALHMRNFVMAGEYISILSEYDKRYESLWSEIQDLLATIRKKLSGRMQKDIMLYWLDAIPYGDESDMSYLRKTMADSIVFENAYTNIGHTKATLRAMFLGKKDIDDRVYRTEELTRENSPVIRCLEEQGYDIKVYSGLFNDLFHISYSPSSFYLFLFAPVSRKLWDVLIDMVSEEKKTLWIIHALEGHNPYLNSRMVEGHYKDAADRRARYRLARKELDEQLAFYDSFVGKDTYRIYMSDHGQYHPDIYHVLFNIYHKSLKPRKVKGLFSLLDFGTVIKQLVSNEEGGDIKEQELLREYIEIGNFDRYAKTGIKQVFRDKLGLSMLFIGQKGIIDTEYIYIHYKTGKEWLQRRKNMPLVNPLLFYDCESDVCEPELLPKYRELAGEYPEDIILDEQFKYTRYLYVLYHNILKHNNMPERVEMINRRLTNYPDNSVGIRMGGVTAAMLYYVLSKENKRKIWGFIDNSDHCLCSKLHLPIVHCDQMEKLEAVGVRAVLIPSYTFLEMLREESKTWPAGIEILDIYDQFSKNGIGCREDFYKLKGTDEDYQVGFPFDED